MEHDYNFLADLLTTYRSNPDWLKFFWLFIPAALVTLCGHGIARLLRARRSGLAAGGEGGGEAGSFGDIGPYRIRADANGRLYLEPVKEVPQITAQTEESELR